MKQSLNSRNVCRILVQDPLSSLLLSWNNRPYEASGCSWRYYASRAYESIYFYSAKVWNLYGTSTYILD